MVPILLPGMIVWHRFFGALLISRMVNDVGFLTSFDGRVMDTVRFPGEVDLMGFTYI